MVLKWAMLNPRRKICYPIKRAFKLLVLAGVLLFSQSLLLAHQHNVDLEPAGGSVVCQLCLHHYSADLPPVVLALEAPHRYSWKSTLPQPPHVSIPAETRRQLPRAPPFSLLF